VLEHPSGGPRVKTVACLAGVSLERDVPCEEIHDYIQEAENLVWVDVQDPGPAEVAMLEEEFGFHSLALEDAAMGQQRPKVDEYKSYVFAVTYAAASGRDTRKVQTIEVDLFIGRNFLVTLHRGRVPALEEAYTRWTRGGQTLREGIGFLVYAVMDAIVDSYAPISHAIEDELEETQLQMFTGFREGSVQHLLALKRTLFALRRVLNPLREIFHLFLRRDRPLFSAETGIYFQDVYNHLLRILDTLEIEREMVSGALDAYLAVKGDQLNTTMKLLTSLSVVVGLMDCLLDAYGMGLSGTPFLHAPWGFWGVMFLEIILIAVALLVSRRLGWL
jgi:magnesium transporter